MRYFLTELGLVGGTTAGLLVVFPNHPFAVQLVVAVSWVLFQLLCAYSFMSALYRGDIVEYRTNPRTYAVAPRGVVNWRAHRFMTSYLRVAQARNANLSVPAGSPASCRRAATSTPDRQ